MENKIADSPRFDDLYIGSSVTAEDDVEIALAAIQQVEELAMMAAIGSWASVGLHPPTCRTQVAELVQFATLVLQGAPAEARIVPRRVALMHIVMRKELAGRANIRGIDAALTAHPQKEGARPQEGAGSAPPQDPFHIDVVRAHLEKAQAKLLAVEGYSEIAASIAKLLAGLEGELADLVKFDRELAAIDEKIAALACLHLTNEQILAIDRELNLQLKPYRASLNDEQLDRLRQSFFGRMVYALAGLPRLSLFCDA